MATRQPRQSEIGLLCPRFLLPLLSNKRGIPISSVYQDLGFSQPLPWNMGYRPGCKVLDSRLGMYLDEIACLQPLIKAQQMASLSQLLRFEKPVHCFRPSFYNSNYYRHGPLCLGRDLIWVFSTLLLSQVLNLRLKSPQKKHQKGVVTNN